MTKYFYEKIKYLFIFNFYVNKLKKSTMFFAVDFFNY